MTFELAKLAQLEAAYRCRYEVTRDPVTGECLGAFPVTHTITGVVPKHGHAAPAYAHVGIGNLESLNWRIFDINGRTLTHGSEQNFSRTRKGYVRMLRYGLRHVRLYGEHGVVRRVYPRELAHRAVPAGENPWTDRRWLAPITDVSDDQAARMRVEAETDARAPMVDLAARLDIDPDEWLQVWALSPGAALIFFGLSSHSRIVTVLKQKPTTAREIKRYRPEASLYGIKAISAVPGAHVDANKPGRCDAAWRAGLSPIHGSPDDGSRCSLPAGHDGEHQARKA